MEDISFPSSGGFLEAFLERIRYSPRARVDIDWLVRCLGISQRPNAGRSLDWLKTTGILSESGLLSFQGRELLTFSQTRRHRNAASKAVQKLLRQEQLVALRAGKLNRLELRRQLCEQYGIKDSAANKAIVGMYSLAESAGDEPLMKALGRTGFNRHKPVEPKIELTEAKASILADFSLFSGRTGGIDGWLNEQTPQGTFRRLVRSPLEPLTKAQLNQLLTLAHTAPLSEGFFKYYWLKSPPHPYDLRSIPRFSEEWIDSLAIFDIGQLYWGLYRFYVDALLFFGNIRAAYQVLRHLDYEQLEDFFQERTLNPGDLVARGPSLPLNAIARDDRYLISEMACKSYEPGEGAEIGMEQALKEAFAEFRRESNAPTTPGFLLDKKNRFVAAKHPDLQGSFWFAAEEILDAPISSLEDLEGVLSPIKARFTEARCQALENTKLYLASVGDMDAYVATSMRSRADFRDMAAFCDQVFGSRRLHKFHLRFFDPTLSAAANHQDKGLIECLMVKCAKVLVYNSGEKESFGKDAEAAMALSLGKPVIFFCQTSERQEFYKAVHPLSRLVDFESGVAVGAIVTDSEEDVIELLDRLFSNSMTYVLEQKSPGYFVLKESLTGSIVRLQTNDDLLRETFWNHYHGMRGTASMSNSGYLG